MRSSLSVPVDPGECAPLAEKRHGLGQERDADRFSGNLHSDVRSLWRGRRGSSTEVLDVSLTRVLLRMQNDTRNVPGNVISRQSGVIALVAVRPSSPLQELDPEGFGSLFRGSRRDRGIRLFCDAIPGSNSS